MSAAWIAIACAERVRLGKAVPLRRIRPGDAVAYYSPTITLRGKAACRSFTAAGIVAEGEPYVVDMGAGFQAWRRDVRSYTTHEAPIAPLLDRLAFTADRKNWGYRFRFGLIAVGRSDFELIVAVMTGDTAGVSQAV